TRTYLDGEKMLFSILIVDNTDDVRTTFFGTKQQIENIWSTCEPGKSVAIRGGKVSAGDTAFNIRSSALEVKVQLSDNEAGVENCEADIYGNPRFERYQAIGNLTDVGSKGAVVDVIAVIQAIEKPKSTKTKRGEVIKSAVTLTDKTNVSVKATFWGQSAAQ
uniref:REPA_OB_2 domain-containing protein n=1 Tax=Macrostomum lignano TaxID=282301 RepID=A0A1I8JGB7_9PLAT